MGKGGGDGAIVNEWYTVQSICAVAVSLECAGAGSRRRNYLQMFLDGRVNGLRRRFRVGPCAMLGMFGGRFATKLLQMADAFCFTARLSGDMLGSSLRGVTYAKALHRAAHLHCVACSSAATAGPKLWVSRQDVDPCTTDQDGASRQR